jgi:hypothetical protein
MSPQPSAMEPLVLFLCNLTLQNILKKKKKASVTATSYGVYFTTNAFPEYGGI